MKNPILAGLNQNRALQMMRQIKSLGNPQAMLQQMPQYKQIMEYVNANGGDARAAFYAKAEEMGINPDDILSQLR